MPARVSEAFVLRTYPLRESDLIVSFFTRDQGKLRGTARGAKKPKSPFGAGLQRLSLVKMYYSQRELRELVTLTGCDLLHSNFGVLSEYGPSVALDFMAEIAEQTLPADEPHERYFRLLASVLEYLTADPEGHLWAAVTYYSFWTVRLGGYLPELRLTPESLELAEEMAVTPIGRLAARQWTKQTAQDLRRFLVRQLEEQVEKRFLTVPLLEAL